MVLFQAKEIEKKVDAMLTGADKFYKNYEAPKNEL